LVDSIRRHALACVNNVDGDRFFLCRRSNRYSALCVDCLYCIRQDAGQPLIDLLVIGYIFNNVLILCPAL
jgi:hypothetical protein